MRWHGHNPRPNNGRRQLRHQSRPRTHTRPFSSQAEPTAPGRPCVSHQCNPHDDSTMVTSGAHASCASAAEDVPNLITFAITGQRAVRWHACVSSHCAITSVPASNTHGVSMAHDDGADGYKVRMSPRWHAAELRRARRQHPSHSTRVSDLRGDDPRRLRQWLRSPRPRVGSPWTSDEQVHRRKRGANSARWRCKCRPSPVITANDGSMSAVWFVCAWASVLTEPGVLDVAGMVVDAAGLLAVGEGSVGGRRSREVPDWTTPNSQNLPVISLTYVLASL